MLDKDVHGAVDLLGLKLVCLCRTTIRAGGMPGGCNT